MDAKIYEMVSDDRLIFQPFPIYSKVNINKQYVLTVGALKLLVQLNSPAFIVAIMLNIVTLR